MSNVKSIPKLKCQMSKNKFCHLGFEIYLTFGFWILTLLVLPFSVLAVAPIESSITVSVTIQAPSPPPSGGGGGVYVPPETNIVFKGKAYPKAFITVLKNSQVTGTIEADKQGIFQSQLSGLAPGIYTFGLYAEDSQGRKSATINFTISLTAGTTTTLSGIFFPPTIELSDEKLSRGQLLDIQGQTYPKSTVTIFVFSEETSKEVLAKESGDWLYSLKTDILDEGAHTTKAKSISTEGDISAFSETKSFEIIGVCQTGDLNCDTKVDLVDFSILMFNWGAPLNRRADINQDSIVDLIDFSIMMYYWSG